MGKTDKNPFLINLPGFPNCVFLAARIPKV